MTVDIIYNFEQVTADIDESYYFPYASDLIERTWQLLKTKTALEVSEASLFMKVLLDEKRLNLDHELALQCKSSEDADHVRSSNMQGDYSVLQHLFDDRFNGSVVTKYILPDFIFTQTSDKPWHKSELTAAVAMLALSFALYSCEVADGLHNENLKRELLLWESTVDKNDVAKWLRSVKQAARKEAWGLSLVASSLIILGENMRMEYVQELLKMRAQSDRARNLNSIKHRKTYAAKEQVLTVWAQKRSDFPSATKAGFYFQSWLREQGLKDHEPGTITKWIRDYAKEKGIKLR